MAKRIFLLRHGETEWTLSKRHTGQKSDIPLTKNGELQADGLKERLEGVPFSAVFYSPLIRVKETCKRAGLFAEAVEDRNLLEWDYGEFEGKTTEEIRCQIPDWTIFTHDPPGGETKKDVGLRARTILDRALAIDGDVALFSSGHFTRVMGVSWLGLDVSCGKHFALSTASLSVLSFEHEAPTIFCWNDTSHYQKGG